MAHPKRYDDNDPFLTKLSEISLAFPEAKLRVSHGRPNFHTTKTFAYYGGSVKGDHDNDQWSQSVLVKPPVIERDALLAEDRFFVPAYVGASGWIGLNFRAEKPDWDEVAELVDGSYRQTAPTRLIRILDSN